MLGNNPQLQCYCGPTSVPPSHHVGWYIHAVLAYNGHKMSHIGMLTWDVWMQNILFITCIMHVKFKYAVQWYSWHLLSCIRQAMNISHAWYGPQEKGHLLPWPHSADKQHKGPFLTPKGNPPMKEPSKECNLSMLSPKCPLTCASGQSFQSVYTEKEGKKKNLQVWVGTARKC